MRLRLSWLGLGLVAVALPAAALPAGFTLEVIPDQVQHPTAWESALSDSGDVVWRYGFFGFGGNSGIASWSRGTGTQVVASQNGAAPGAPGESFSSFGFQEFHSYGGFVINDLGQVAFRNGVYPMTPDGTHAGLWGPGTGGNLSLLARYGQPLPGDSSGGLVGVSGPAPFPDVAARLLIFNHFVDDAGRTSLTAQFQQGPGGITGSNDTVFYRSDGAGSGTVLVREGDPVPGTPGATFTGGGAGFESHADTGFAASTTAGTGLFLADDAGSLTRLGFAGDSAPGTSGAVFSSFDSLRRDTGGSLTFRASLQTGVAGVTSANDIGYWGPDGSGHLALIAREGGQAPGTPAGAVFLALNAAPISADIDDAGIAFRAALVTGVGGVTSANDTGVWRADGSGFGILLAREGDAVPGLSGATFASLSDVTLAANGLGEVAFEAGLTVGTGGVTSANDRALFYADPFGTLQLLLREGESVLGVPNFAGTLRDFEVTGLNEAGDLLVNGIFTAGNYLMVISVPEPSTGLLVGLGIALLTRARR